MNNLTAQAKQPLHYRDVECYYQTKCYDKSKVATIIKTQSAKYMVTHWVWRCWSWYIANNTIGFHEQLKQGQTHKLHLASDVCYGVGRSLVPCQLATEQEVTYYFYSSHELAMGSQTQLCHAATRGHTIITSKRTIPREIKSYKWSHTRWGLFRTSKLREWSMPLQQQAIERRWCLKFNGLLCWRHDHSCDG